MESRAPAGWETMTTVACALAADADLIVSGDHALLNLKHYHDIAIVAPRAAVERVAV